MNREEEIASLRARVLVALMRRVIKPRSLDEPDPMLSRAFANRFVLPAALVGARRREGRIGGVPGEWIGDDRRRATLLYVHGGAYVIGSPATHRPITSGFARRGFRVFAPDYRLAPEHRFPAALDDVVAVYRGLLEEGVDPARIALAGDSSGGGLALAALLRIRDLGLPRPAAAALFSPWTDLALTGETMWANARRDPMLNPHHGASVARHYLGDTDPRDPLVSPLYADLSGLPPLLLHVGESELLRDDSVRLARKARAAGVEVELRVWPVVPHVWQLLAPLMPEARQSLDGAAMFLRRRLKAAAAAA